MMSNFEQNMLGDKKASFWLSHRVMCIIKGLNYQSSDQLDIIPLSDWIISIEGVQDLFLLASAYPSEIVHQMGELFWVIAHATIVLEIQDSTHLASILQNPLACLPQTVLSLKPITYILHNLDYPPIQHQLSLSGECMMPFPLEDREVYPRTHIIIDKTLQFNTSACLYNLVISRITRREDEPCVFIKGTQDSKISPPEIQDVELKNGGLCVLHSLGLKIRDLSVRNSDYGLFARDVEEITMLTNTDAYPVYPLRDTTMHSCEIGYFLRDVDRWTMFNQGTSQCKTSIDAQVKFHCEFLNCSFNRGECLGNLDMGVDTVLYLTDCNIEMTKQPFFDGKFKNTLTTYNQGVIYKHLVTTPLLDYVCP